MKQMVYDLFLWYKTMETRKDFQAALLFSETVPRHTVSMIHMQPPGAPGVLGAFWDAGFQLHYMNLREVLDLFPYS